jgi:hypothetical protein
MTLDLQKPQTGDQCLICGDHPNVIGVFIPDAPEAWGAPIGKTRLFRYCLCLSCSEKPDKKERVEKIIRNELTGGGIKYA